MNNLLVLLSQSVSILTHSSYDISQIIFGNSRWSRRIYAYKNQFFDYTFIRIRMTSKNIEVCGSNLTQESCVSSVESTVPEHLDAGINNGDDSFETWVSAESEFDNTIDETWVSAESEFNNSSGDLMETSQSCVVIGSIPGFL